VGNERAIAVLAVSNLNHASIQPDLIIEPAAIPPFRQGDRHSSSMVAKWVKKPDFWVLARG